MQALADFNEAIRLDHKVSWYYKLRGALYAARGETEKGMADLNEAIRLDPKDFRCLLYRSRIYAEKGDLDKAIADITEAIRLSPKSGDAYQRRADLYARSTTSKRPQPTTLKPRGCGRRMIGIDSGGNHGPLRKLLGAVQQGLRIVSINLFAARPHSE